MDCILLINLHSVSLKDHKQLEHDLIFFANLLNTKNEISHLHKYSGL